MPRRKEMKDTRCLICGNGKLREEISEFRSHFVDDQGRRRDVIVPNVKKFRCDACDEYILDPASESRISVMQRAAMGLLGASDLHNFRNRLHKTQEEMASLLGLGKKTWCRWESNDHFQSEAFDRFLRLLVEVPSNVEMLGVIRKRKQEDETDAFRTASQVFVYLKQVEFVQEFERQFTAMFDAGEAFTA
jgi:putative zinc finger/helix-turn-helix YgiT family protein